MLKHQHHDFPSDLCTIFDAGKAKIKIYDFTSQSYSIHDIHGNDGLLKTNMADKVCSVIIIA